MSDHPTELSPALRTTVTKAAGGILLSLPEAKGKMIPQALDMAMKEVWPDHGIFAVTADYADGPEIVLYFYRVFGRDGGEEWLFLARVNFRAWRKNRETVEVQRPELARIKRKNAGHFPTVVCGQECDRALHQAQMAGILPVK